MTTHKLAKILLEQEDIPVVLPSYKDCVGGYNELCTYEEKP